MTYYDDLVQIGFGSGTTLMHVMEPCSQMQSEVNSSQILYLYLMLI